jgi:hypothetical protein
MSNGGMWIYSQNSLGKSNRFKLIFSDDRSSADNCYYIAKRE